MERAIPILPADDLEVARTFYVEGLGFRVAFEASEDGRAGLLGIERGGIRLTLDCPMDGHGRNACVSLEVDDADAYYREWSAKVPVLRSPRDEDWGARTFDLIDPSGNTIFVMEPVAAGRGRSRVTPIRRSGFSLPATGCGYSLGDFTSAICSTVTSKSDEAALMQIQQTLAKAWVTGDRATIERILAPEWHSTGPNGRLSDRAAVLRDVFESRVHRVQRVEVDEVRITVFGDAAVVTGRTHGVGEFGGTPYDVLIRFTDTFLRQGGQWQAVASHASLVTMNHP